MQKILFSSLVMAGVSAPFSNPAQASEQAGSLPEIVVTATRTETKSDELAAAVTVITREDIERTQVRTLPDLLKGSTGVDVVQQGGYGQPASVFMRGTESGHVLVLIDGIKAGSVTLGTTAFELIPVDQIERVEIIRGPQSSLYGSEAIGGVIQIFTRKGKQAEKPTVTANVGAGSFDTHQEAGNVSGRWKKSWYSLGASNLDSQGFRATLVPPAGSIAKRDGYRNTAVNARAGYRFDNNAEVEAFFMRAEGTNQFDNFPGYATNREFVNQVVGTAASLDIFDNWRTNLRLGQTQDKNTSLLADGSFSDRFDTTRWNASWFNQLLLSKNHQLTLGSDYRLDEVDSSTNYDQKSRYNVGVFGELHSRIFDRQFVNASIRWDKFQSFGDTVTGNLGWRFNWDYGLSAFASFGNAFKAPTLNQLYYPLDGWGYHGNPNLKAEQSRSFEAGFAGKHAYLQWELRAYHTNVENLINWSIGTQPINIDKAEIQGLEAEIAYQFLGIQQKLNMNMLDPRDQANHHLLPNRAERTLSYDISRSFGAFDVGAKALVQSGRFNDPDNKVRLGGYATFDLRTAYHIDKNWMLAAKLNNILDKQYQTVDNYTTFGRNFFLTVHYTY